MGPPGGGLTGWVLIQDLPQKGKNMDHRGGGRHIYIYIYIYIVRLGSGPSFAILKVRFWTNFLFRCCF